MRLSPKELEGITGLSLPSAQARWFREHYGVALPADRRGPIITEAAFEGLVAKRCGLAVVEAARPRLSNVRAAAKFPRPVAKPLCFCPELEAPAIIGC